jgi:hypothetical protein
MNVRFFFSSPNGDIPLSEKDLRRAFLVTPNEAHPFLTLGDYFESIQAVLIEDRAVGLLPVLKNLLQREIAQDDIRELVIRSEKHGAFYHIASVEIFTDLQTVKLAISTALSSKGKALLRRDSEILDHLNQTFNLPYLPKVYYMREAARLSGKTGHESFVHLLGEWFEDYHEWHLTPNAGDGSPQVCLWDMQRGHRRLSQDEAVEIFKQASKILTLYFDLTSFKQIYPWHHAAGDFIVKANNGAIDVKLVTARQYASFMDRFSDDAVNPMIATLYFFLNLTVRMRLDRLDGVGEPLWVENFSVRAALEGFIEAMMMMEETGRYTLGKTQDLLELLCSFDASQWEGLLQSLMVLYQGDNPEELAVVRANLGNHAQCLQTAIRDYGLKVS